MQKHNSLGQTLTKHSTNKFIDWIKFPCLVIQLTNRYTLTNFQKCTRKEDDKMADYI